MGSTMAQCKKTKFDLHLLKCFGLHYNKTDIFDL